MPCGSSQPLIPLDEAVPVRCAELGVMRTSSQHPMRSSAMSRSRPSVCNGPMLAWLHGQGATLFQDVLSIGDPHLSRVFSCKPQEPVLRLSEPSPSSMQTPIRRYRIPAERLTTDGKEGWLGVLAVEHSHRPPPALSCIRRRWVDEDGGSGGQESVPR